MHRIAWSVADRPPLGAKSAINRRGELRHVGDEDVGVGDLRLQGKPSSDGHIHGLSEHGIAVI